MTSSSRGPRASGQVCGSWVGVASCPTSSTFSPSFHRRRASSARGGHGVARGVRRAPWPGPAARALDPAPPDARRCLLRSPYCVLKDRRPGAETRKAKARAERCVWSLRNKPKKREGSFLCEKSCRSGMRLYSKIPEVTPFYFTPAAHTLTASQPHRNFSRSHAAADPTLGAPPICTSTMRGCVPGGTCRAGAGAG